MTRVPWFLTLLLIVCGSVNVPAAELYVAPNGDDANPGTLAAAQVASGGWSRKYSRPKTAQSRLLCGEIRQLPHCGFNLLDNE